MTIKSVSLIGLGALGVLFGHQLSQKVADFTVVADQARIDRYVKDGIYSNGEKCEFRYAVPKHTDRPADLIIFAVKYNSLDEAIEVVRGRVGEHTILLSLLNGISSEEVIGNAFGINKVVYCVAEQMDAVKVGNRLIYANKGKLVFGDKQPGVITENVRAVDEFLSAAEIPHTIETQMIKKLWSKFMVNVGVNQVVAVYGDHYADIQKPGVPRDMMIAAMREVMALSEKEGIYLNETDFEYWMNVLDSINPEGKPSMRQDVESKRLSELELFAGTVLRLGRKHHLKMPVNAMLYEEMKKIESTY